MSMAKRMIEEQLDRDECMWCSKTDEEIAAENKEDAEELALRDKECLRCTESFRVCGACSDEHSLCDYCQHMTDKDD